MTPTIDKAKTGQQIRLLMEKRGVTVRDVKNALSLACVQSVYHWLDGQSMPPLDNLYALSELLRVPMDMLVCGNRRYDPKKNIPAGAERLFRQGTKVKIDLCASLGDFQRNISDFS